MKHRQHERGVALIICLFALMLLSGIGLGMMYMADTETSVNRNYRYSQQAYFAALAGLQETRPRLMTGSGFPVPTSLPQHNVNTGVVYVLNYTASIPRDSITPWNMDASNPYRDTEFCHENFTDATNHALVPNTGPNQPCTAVPSGTYYTTVDSSLPSALLGTDINLAYRWVRINWKANASAVPSDPASTPTGFYVASGTPNNVQICWDGEQEIRKPASYLNNSCDADPPDGIHYLKSVYVLTSFAVTPNANGSRRIVQMEVANNPPLVTNAAVDTNDFVTVSGSSVTVNGFDNCKCSCTDPPGGRLPSCTLRNTNPVQACTGSTYAIYSSQRVSTSGNPAIVAGSSCAAGDEHCTNPAIAQNQAFPFNMDNLIAKYSTMGGVVNTTNSAYSMHCNPSTTNPPGYPNCGTLASSYLGSMPNPFPPTDPAHPVYPSDPVGPTNSTGPQITYVPGSLDIQAQTTGSGILIIDGDLTIHGGFQFYGLIIVRGLLTYSGGGHGQDGSQVVGSIIAGQGSVADSIAGSVRIQYDRCALLNTQRPQPPQLLATHETMY